MANHPARIDETANFDVYCTDGGKRYYFEHKRLGDDCAYVAVVEGAEVVDLDMCAVLADEPAAFLRARGISTSAATVDGS